MPAVSIVTVPVTAHFLLPDAQISTKTLFVVLGVFQLLPLLVGLFISERAPELAARLVRPIGIVMLLGIIVLLALLVPALVMSVAAIYGSGGMWAMLVIVVLSVLTGWILGGPQREYQRTLGLGTAVRSFAFCAVIASASFPGTEAISAVLSYFVIQMVVTAAVGAYFQRTAQAAA